MKKKFLFTIGIFFIGLVIGIVVTVIVIEQCGKITQEIGSLLQLAEIDLLVDSVCQTNEYNSAVILQEYKIRKIEDCENYIFDEEKKEILKTDKGIAHAKLYIIYNKRGEDKLARQEYNKSFILLRDRYKLESEDELQNIIEMIKNQNKL